MYVVVRGKAPGGRGVGRGEYGAGQRRGSAACDGGESEAACDDFARPVDQLPDSVAGRRGDVVHGIVDCCIGTGCGVDASAGGDDGAVGSEERHEDGVILGRRGDGDEELDEGLDAAVDGHVGGEKILPVDRGSGVRVGALLLE